MKQNFLGRCIFNRALRRNYTSRTSLLRQTLNPFFDCNLQIFDCTLIPPEMARPLDFYILELRAVLGTNILSPIPELLRRSEEIIIAEYC